MFKTKWGGLCCRKNLFIMVLASVLIFAGSAWGRTFDTIVAFGDSLSDHGGLAAYSGTIGPVPNSWTNNGATPYGGDVWLDYLINSGVANVLDNWAIGGAMTDGHESAGIQTLINNHTLPDLGFVGQVTRYLATSPTIDLDTLYAIWIGGNDCLEFFRGEYYTSDPQVMMDDATDRIVNQMGLLYASGARYFLVLNLPDFAKAPAFNTKDFVTKAQVAQVANGFNAYLSAKLAAFKAVNPDATVYTADVFSILHDVINKDIFIDEKNTYLTVDANCNWVVPNVNGPYTDYLFFDCIHPTTAAHELVAGALNFGDLAMDNGAQGLWHFNGINAWTPISAGNAVATAFFKGKLYAAFDGSGPAGLWKYDGFNFSKLGGATPSSLCVSGDFLYLAYPGYGLYKYDGVTQPMTKIGGAVPSQMISVGTGLLVAYPGYGLYGYDGVNQPMTKLCNALPDLMTSAFDTYGFAAFSGDGLYKYDGTAMNIAKLGVAVPSVMVESGAWLYVTYPGYGLYKYDNETQPFTKLGGGVPSDMIAYGPAGLLVSYPGYGLYEFDGVNQPFTKLSNALPGKMMGGNNAFLDYAGVGLFEYDGTATQIAKPAGVTNVSDQLIDLN